jgi:hypothetical protein
LSQRIVSKLFVEEQCGRDEGGGGNYEYVLELIRLLRALSRSKDEDWTTPENSASSRREHA